MIKKVNEFFSKQINQFYFTSIIAISAIIVSICSKMNNDSEVSNNTDTMSTHLIIQLISAIVCILSFGWAIFSLCKYWVEKKLEVINKQINTNKEEFQGFINNIYNFNHIRYNSITTRLFRDSLLWYVVNKDKEFLNHFADLMYRSHITVSQLEDYGMGKDFIDAYKLHIHNVEYNNVANNNPIVADIYEGNHNEQKEPDINLENKTD